MDWTELGTEAVDVDLADVHAHADYDPGTRAGRLRLRHPETGEDLVIEAPLPPDMAEAIRLLNEES